MNPLSAILALAGASTGAVIALNESRAVLQPSPAEPSTLRARLQRMLRVSDGI